MKRRSHQTEPILEARALANNDRAVDAFSPLGKLPVLVPFTGLLTILGTVTCGCMVHFTCTEKYPTLSTSAMYYPQFYIFGLGMNATSYLIFLTVSLFTKYLQREFKSKKVSPFQRFYARIYFFFGLLTSIGLTVLCTFDMKRWPNTHIIATIFFFVSSWCMMAMAQFVRWKLNSNEHAKGVQKGLVCLILGIFFTLSFALLYVSVHGYIANPWRFTYSQESLCELFSIVCQLLYMGTKASEVGSLVYLSSFVGFRDYVIFASLMIAIFVVDYV